jgi:hypothetical protein
MGGGSSQHWGSLGKMEDRKVEFGEGDRYRNEVVGKQRPSSGHKGSS